MSDELQPVRDRRNWRGIVADYNAIILDPVDTSECCYCLTAPQVQLLIMYADTLRWRTRWENWDGDTETIEDFANNLIERLMMSCCGEQNESILHRVLSKDGNYAMQISMDGGTSWVTDNSDPRITYTSQPPLPGDTPDLKCQAAWNIRKAFEDIVPVIASVLGATLSLFAVAVAIGGVLLAFLLSPLEPLKYVPVVINLVGYLLGLSATEFSDAFSTSDYEKLQCAAFCMMDDNGQINDLGGFVDKVCELVDCNTIPGNTFRLIAYAMGLLFINSAAGTMHGANTYDCTACDCGGGCPLETWEVQVGTEVPDTRTTSTITVDAFHSGSDYIVAVNSPGTGIDCCKMGYTLLTEGVTLSLSGAINCDDPQDGGHIFYSYTGATPVNYYILVATVPFTARVSGT